MSVDVPVVEVAVKVANSGVVEPFHLKRWSEAEEVRARNPFMEYPVEKVCTPEVRVFKV